MAAGPLALLGSGEFLPVMDRLDAGLLSGRQQRAVFLPTAAAQEGPARIQYWVDLGLAHFRHLGVDVEAIMVLSRQDAEAESKAAQVEGAGLLYLSGGDPIFLAQTLRDSAVGSAIRAAWEAGMAVAGCSAGAMALAEAIPRLRDPQQPTEAGLGLINGMMIVPHFDRIDRWMHGATELAVASAPAGDWVLGIDDETAVVGSPAEWEVYGSGSAWLMKADMPRRQFSGSERFSTTEVADQPI